ncbi:peptidylprolyl isomerase [Parvicella tangerina]|uniref:Chaperone SurA n=1 Tax=Parvicella tangerina TaxID=2829795 RepID=A0A916JKZ4_9FLAO|nr:peptidylprolyl isomerase [Parvicella tangerina]CAG5080095.1 Chaperone SurA [Parvicella tangerina]
MINLKKTSVTVLLLVVSLVSSAQNKLIDKVVAVVGEHAILMSEVEAQKLQAYQQGTKVTDELGCTILEDLMLEKLLLHQAELDSIEVGEAQVNAELDQRIQYFASQMPNGVADLEKFYEKSIQEIKDEFYVQIENRMKVQQMQQSITSEVKVSPKEVQEFYNSFPLDSVPLVGSQIQLQQIILKPNITDEEKKEVKDELTDLRKKIVKGSLSFESAAKFYSCDKASAEQGGDFGWVGRGQFVPQFEAMAYQTPIDSVSPVFETQYGYHILRIEKRRGEQFYGRHILLCLKPSFEQLAVCKKRLDSIRTAIKSGSITFEEAVTEFSDDEMTKGTQGIVYNQNTGTSFLDIEDIDPVTFQQIDPIDVGQMSKSFLFETYDGQSYKLVKLLDKTAPHRANLKDDYQLIQQFAKQNKQNNYLLKWVNTKLNDIFVRLDEDYQSCEFRFDWTREN